jgi:hypothetical protein
MARQFSPTAAAELEAYQSGDTPRRERIRRPAWKPTRAEREAIERALTGRLRGTKVA